MIATYIPLIPPAAATQTGLEPEKLAAVLARYSRSKEGADSLCLKFGHLSTEAIFKFVDYGHASIGGLTGGIALALDGASMLLACKLFEFAQLADGQESSTRYITLGIDALPEAGELGIPENLRPLWKDTCQLGFELYEYCQKGFDSIAKTKPESLKLPEQALRDEKLKTRLVKNYGLDRARYFLPLACQTNVAVVATARVWADTLRLLESLQWPEAIKAAVLLRSELAKAAPNLIRHSHPDNASIAFVQDMLQEGTAIAATENYFAHPVECKCRLEVFDPATAWVRTNSSIKDALRTRGSRYNHTGTALKRQVVQMEWSAMAIAELRDLNRHRAGFRFSDWGPRGFYIPQETQTIIRENNDAYEKLGKFQEAYLELVTDLARKGQCGLQAYGYFLGTQIPFEHTQAADKFLYEVELRTGLGAHFRYAEHLKQAAGIYFEKYPEARGGITIGDAEPE